MKVRAQEVKSRIFELSGGHPALDLVNTLDWRFRDSGPEELLEDYADVVRFVEQTGLMNAMDARKLLRSASENKAAKVLVSVRDLREAAAELLYAAVDGKSPSSSALKRLEEFFASAREQQKLRWDGEKLEWALPQASSFPSFPLWLLSLNTETLITSEQMPLLRECGNAECRWLFIDTSKNHTRRWCDMKICGNRMKARRFKAQHRD
ncbi:MAG: CGNR zinc finger domain-containing protein [Acidobacteria bacterium]|nr:CGNR zinc finger domain-containing protein [Acidobacteriota bacterium]